MPALRIFLIAAFMLSVAACTNDSATDSPYVEITGGGFVFNYRTAIADYGFVMTVKRKLEPGIILEATFENPSGGQPFVVTHTAESGRIRYTFRTPPVQGVEANRDYRVLLRLLYPQDKRVLASYEKHFRSNVAQTAMPAAPLTVGPGYKRP